MSCLIKLTEASGGTAILVNVAHIVSVSLIRWVDPSATYIRKPVSRIFCTQGPGFDVIDDVKDIYRKYVEIYKTDDVLKSIMNHEEPVLNKPVFPTLNLRPRTVNAIMRQFNGTYLSEFIQIPAKDMLDWSGFADVALEEVREELKKLGLCLKGDENLETK